MPNEHGDIALIYSKRKDEVNVDHLRAEDCVRFKADTRLLCVPVVLPSMALAV